jgi:hypothetical protein
VAEHSENRNQDTTVHIEALIESIPPFARRQSALNASTSGYTKEQRRAVVDPALAAAVDHWTHFSVDTDTSNMTMRHEWPVMGRKKDLPFQLHSGWTTHSRCARREERCHLARLLVCPYVLGSTFQCLIPSTQLCQPFPLSH